MTSDQVTIRRASPSTSGGCARFVGRVGGLAVALGIGAALAGGTGVGWADPGSPSTSSSSSDGSSGKDAADTGAAKNEAGAKTDAAKQADTDAGAAAEGGDDAAPKTSASDEPKKQSKPRSHRQRPTSEVRDDRPGARDRESSRPDDARAVDKDVDKAVDKDVEKEDATPNVAPEPSSTASVDAGTVAARHVSMTVAHEDEPTATVARPPDLVAEVVTGLLSAVGLSPRAAHGPTAPAAPPSPVGLAMAGLARREVGVDAALATSSPLHTQQQLTAEQLAAQAVDTLPVALMKLVLRAGFMSAAQQQFSLVGGPDAANVAQLDAAVNEYAMAAAFQQQILNSNQPTVVTQVAPPHTWGGALVPGSRILYDNPDTVYRFMGVNGASSYVITGSFDGDMPADTTFSVLTGLTGNTSYVLTKDQLVLGSDGRSFTITADSSPANGRPNHLQLTSDTTLIAARNTLSDWTNEQPMTLEITRVGGPPNSLFSQLGGFAIPGIGPAVVNNPLLTTLVSLVPPLPFDVPILRGTVTAVIMALGIQRESTYMAVATTDPATGELRQPNVLPNPSRNAEFLATQLQSAGYFQLADDEALVVTIDPGNANYFVVPVTNDWTITRDYWNEQTSLNISQATPNDDGTYTIVISKADPTVNGQHVANWVSTGGLNQGTVSMRFQDLDLADPNTPTVSAQKVALGQLDTVLPPGTTYLTDVGREAQLAERKAGFDARWGYPQP